MSAIEKTGDVDQTVCRLCGENRATCEGRLPLLKENFNIKIKEYDGKYDQGS